MAHSLEQLLGCDHGLRSHNPRNSFLFFNDDSGPGPTVEPEDGSLFPAWCDVYVRVDDDPWITLRIVVEDGRPILDTFFVARSRGFTGPLTATAIHKITVDHLFHEAVSQVARFAASQNGREHAGTPVLQRRRISDDLLRQVAGVVGTDPLEMPNQAVQRQLDCSSRTASRWFAAA
jgi:hypothetical protein